MQINDLILRKIDSLDIPDKIKEVLTEILMAEEQMRILNDKNYKANLDKILQRYADCDDVMEFCSTYAP